MSHRPRRRFSQNFLIDEGAIASIIAAIAPRPADRVLEIGPGLGALTQPLAQIVRELHVIEIDRDIVARLRNAYAPHELTIHEGDALEFDFDALGAGLRIVGNLPYHISTPLLFRLVAYSHGLRDAHVMLQSEVVERMVAAPGASEYGRLSVMLQYRFHMEKVLDVPAASFRPAPKVESAVVRMTPRPADAARASDEGVFAETVARAFSQRRKTLRNSLAGYLVPSDFQALGVDPQARAQTLSVEDFVKIADYRASTSGAIDRSPKERG